MTGYRVVGIDPALTHTGLVVVESGRPGDYRVVVAETIRPRSNWPMVQRLTAIQQGARQFLATDASAIVIEDPTGQVRVRTKHNNPRSIAVMALAVGVVISAAVDRGETVALVDTDEWMPKVKSGNFQHIMEKQAMVRYLVGLITMPAGADEHQIMAAGVARYWIESQRINAKLVRTPA